MGWRKSLCWLLVQQFIIPCYIPPFWSPLPRRELMSSRRSFGRLWAAGKSSLEGSRLNTVPLQLHFAWLSWDLCASGNENLLTWFWGLSVTCEKGILWSRIPGFVVKDLDLLVRRPYHFVQWMDCMKASEICETYCCLKACQARRIRFLLEF